MQKTITYLSELYPQLIKAPFYTPQKLLKLGLWVCSDCGCISHESAERCPSCFETKFILASADGLADYLASNLHKL